MPRKTVPKPPPEPAHITIELTEKEAAALTRAISAGLSFWANKGAGMSPVDRLRMIGPPGTLAAIHRAWRKLSASYDEPWDYPYLRAWNTTVHAPSDYDVEAAQQEGAPMNALYRNKLGDWKTLDDVHTPELREELIRIAINYFGAPK